MSETMFDVLLYADVPGVEQLDTFASPLPRARPARYAPASRRGGPWVVMSSPQLRAAISATDAAWSAYENASKSPSLSSATVLEGDGGTRWRIDATGKVVPA